MLPEMMLRSAGAPPIVNVTWESEMPELFGTGVVPSGPTPRYDDLMVICGPEPAPMPAPMAVPQPPIERPWIVPAAEVNANPETFVLAQATAISGVPA